MFSLMSAYSMRKPVMKEKAEKAHNGQSAFSVSIAFGRVEERREPPDEEHDGQQEETGEGIEWKGDDLHGVQGMEIESPAS